jgi:DNA polymerase-3 subunit epsilon
MKDELRLRAMLAAIVAAAVALLVAGLLLLGAWPVEQRALLAQWTAQRAPLLALAVIVALVASVAVAWITQVRRLGFVPHLVHRIELLRSSRPDLRVDAANGVPQALADAVNALARDHAEGQRRHDDELALATQQIEDERDLLAAVLAEQAAAVIACSDAGRVLLYTPAAATLVQQLAPETYLGLGRTVFALFRRSAIQHGLERLALARERGSSHPAAAMLLAMRSGALVHARFTPLAGRRLRGFFLHLHARESPAIANDDDAARRSLASLRAAVEMLRDYSQMNPEERMRFIEIADEESARLMKRVDTGAERRWPLEDMSGETLLELLKTQFENALGRPLRIAGDDGLWFAAESFALSTLLHDYLRQLGGDVGGECSLTLAPRPAHVALVLHCPAVPPLTQERWSRWEQTPLHGSGVQLSPAEILRGHGGDLWQQAEGDGVGLQILLPQIEPAHAPTPPAVEIAAGAPARGSDGELANLIYTAFDTETTGLEPSAGDRIIALAGIRIVDGRIRSREVFDSLIATARRIDPASQRIHGIDAAMLAGQPPAEETLQRFARFCADTVLLGHNAAFDRRFLELHGGSADAVIARPLLDTLLLSQLVYPQAESHQLEAIAERLGLSALGRHTALGDAILTAEVFLRLLPLLASRGIRTLPQALEASRGTAFARLRY